MNSVFVTSSPGFNLTFLLTLASKWAPKVWSRSQFVFCDTHTTHGLLRRESLIWWSSLLSLLLCSALHMQTRCCFFAVQWDPKMKNSASFLICKCCHFRSRCEISKSRCFSFLNDFSFTRHRTRSNRSFFAYQRAEKNNPSPFQQSAASDNLHVRVEEGRGRENVCKRGSHFLNILSLSFTIGESFLKSWLVRRRVGEKYFSR